MPVDDLNVIMTTDSPPSARKYDLEDRTLAFADRTREWIRKLPKTLVNVEDCKQLLRSSGSVGANYREANNAISKADFIYRVRICRKEAKESEYWFQLIRAPFGSDLEKERAMLMQEAKELRLIFAAIILKYEKKPAKT